MINLDMSGAIWLENVSQNSNTCPCVPTLAASADIRICSSDSASTITNSSVLILQPARSLVLPGFQCTPITVPPSVTLGVATVSIVTLRVPESHPHPKETDQFVMLQETCGHSNWLANSMGCGTQRFNATSQTISKNLNSYPKETDQFVMPEETRE